LSNICPEIGATVPASDIRSQRELLIDSPGAEMGREPPAARWTGSLFWRRNAANLLLSSAAPFMAVAELRLSPHGDEPFDQ
jgi:hypothetical protein